MKTMTKWAVSGINGVISIHKSFYLAQCAVEKYLKTLNPNMFIHKDGYYSLDIVPYN